MWLSSRWLVYRGWTETGLHINEISRIYWFQHLLTKQSEWPDGRDTRLADQAVSIMLLILPLSNCDSCSYCLPKRRKGRSTSALPFCQVIYSQFGLAIHLNDHQARRRFVKWAQNEIAVVPNFHKRILFSDEAHFWLNGYVNKQNCRIWSEANPQVYVETPLNPEKLTVWCALWAGGIIGPYFFKNDEDHKVTDNGYRYRAMITNFFIPELNNHDVHELWF
ncbi:putative DD41D transposase [Trichonephila clavipes]|uniref:Putative DD41D transposase n=1 Tax=Trichonephila clavipes TaxID=2585209 RepID=A0A8X6RYB1_TRICX|nr:putative DD41D transposase [Trichonephila clavipes]